ncbi:MAG: sugar phosphate nucleotidyltransferase [Acidimicrobiales bacterium]
MEAIIMTGGKGTRLAPYTDTVPKGLLPVGNTPILDIIVRQLRGYGCTAITMACGHLAPAIQSHFGDGSRSGVSIEYHVEKEPLGTAGPLRAMRLPACPFLVLNCDVLTSLNLQDLFHFHTQGGSLMTVASQQQWIPIHLGVLQVNREKVMRFTEKPRHSLHVNMGIYVMNPTIVDYIPSDGRFDIPDLIGRVLDAGELVHHYENEAYWLDIGQPNDYAKANREYPSIKHRLLPTPAGEIWQSDPYGVN